LTPWLFLSFGVDYWLFGLDPVGFYLHQLALAVMVVVVGYGLLRRWMAAPFAALAMAVFAVSNPAGAVVEQLMTRHYLAGLLLSLIAVTLALWARETGRQRYAWLSAAFYLLACTAKEIYVPLPGLLLLVLRRRSTREWARFALPFFIAGALYLGWRAWMLGPEHLLTGYGDLHETAPASPTDLAVGLSRALGWWPASATWIQPALLAWWFALAGVRRQYRALSAHAWILVLLLLPVAPVLQIVSPRNLILLSFYLACLTGGATACIAGRLHLRSTVARYALVAMLAALSTYPQVTKAPWAERVHVARYRLEGEHVLYGPTAQALADPIAPPWFYQGLAWIREEVLRSGPAPKVCADICLCPPSSWVKASNGALVSWTPVDSQCPEDLRPGAPLEVQIVYRYDPGRVEWTLGPYDEGKWYYIDARDFSRREIPPSGRLPYRLSGVLELLIEYRSPEGWLTRSDAIILDPGAVGADGRLVIRMLR
jgi:hypothetical protein